MINEKFYVLDIEKNEYKTFNNYYQLLSFLDMMPSGSFGNAKEDKRWQQKKISLWEMFRTKIYDNSLTFNNVLYIAYDCFMNVISCKKLELDLIKKQQYLPIYNYKGWRYETISRHNNYLGFRNGPVPFTGKRGSYKWLRNIKTTQERRLNYAYPEYTRGERRNLPSSWEDIGRSDMRNKYSWKKQKKRKQWQ